VNPNVSAPAICFNMTIGLWEKEKLCLRACVTDKIFTWEMETSTEHFYVMVL